MACTTKQTIIDKIVGNATTYKVKEDEVFIPVVGKRDISMTYMIADRLADKINTEYNGKVFGNPVSLNTSYSNGTGINIHVPQLLEDAIQVKEGKKKLEDLNTKILGRSKSNEFTYQGEVFATAEDALNARKSDEELIEELVQLNQLERKCQ